MKHLFLSAAIVIPSLAVAEVRFIYDDTTRAQETASAVEAVTYDFEQERKKHALENRKSLDEKEALRKEKADLEARLLALEKANQRKAAAEKRKLAKKKPKTNVISKQLLLSGSDLPGHAHVNKSEYKLSTDLTQRVINHYGPMPESLPGIASEGADIPLHLAFTGVIPLDWKVYVHAEIDDKNTINWSVNNKNWVDTLYTIGARYNYNFDINWNEQWVLVNKSSMRVTMNNGSNADIEIVGLSVPPGKEGHILIDGKIIKVRSSQR